MPCSLFNAELLLTVAYTGWPKKLTHFLQLNLIRLNFIKYWSTTGNNVLLS